MICSDYSSLGQFALVVFVNQNKTFTLFRRDLVIDRKMLLAENLRSSSDYALIPNSTLPYLT